MHALPTDRHPRAHQYTKSSNVVGLIVSLNKQATLDPTTKFENSSAHLAWNLIDGSTQSRSLHIISEFNIAGPHPGLTLIFPIKIHFFSTAKFLFF
jgi:hypothetical protein